MLLKTVSLLLLLSLALSVKSQVVRPLGVVSAQQAGSGLGFNVNADNDWEFARAAAAGATYVRFDCLWANSESQTPPPLNENTATKFALASYCANGLASARRYGLSVTAIADYAPPSHLLLRVRLPFGAPAGTSQVLVQLASGIGGGTLSSMKPLYDLFAGPNGEEVSPHHSYAGTVVQSVTQLDDSWALITLASALQNDLPADGTLYRINEWLYPPIQTFSVNDASAQHYRDFASYVAQQMAASGVAGEVELWNEDPWPDECWDNMANCEDNPSLSSDPGPKAGYLPSFALPAVMATVTPPDGIRFTWSGASKSGVNSVATPGFLEEAGFSLPLVNTLGDSFHPYGFSPEEKLWSRPCLQSFLNPYPLAPRAAWDCDLGDPANNFWYAAQYNLWLKTANPAWGVTQDITETGYTYGDDAHKARFVLRQFLTLEAAGITPVEFYRLSGGGGYSFLDASTQLPLPNMIAISGLVADIGLIGNAPVLTATDADIPQVRTYNGSFPLLTTGLAGARAGAVANSLLFALWQQSKGSTSTGEDWATLPQPAAGPATVAIPPGMHVTQVLNLTTRGLVDYSLDGDASPQTLSLNVSDDPIEILLDPDAVAPRRVISGTHLRRGAGTIR